MSRVLDRRSFVQTVVAGVAAAAVPGLQVLAAEQAPLRATSLGERLAVIAGAGGNVTVLQGPEGPLLVDGGNAAASAGLLALVALQAGSSAVFALFNTHWHPEQTGSNLALGERGTRIIAHENTRLWLGTDIDSTWQGRHFAPLPHAALPGETFYTTGKLKYGGEQIDYGHLMQAHTDGDIYVYLRSANVLVVGDLLAPGAYPVSDPDTNGWINGMVAANKSLLDLANATTRIVPGQGPVQSRADLQRQYDMLIVVRDRLFDLIKQGLSADEMLAARPTREFDEH
ncbi:MAG: MBL fold metallo-hydrolase, partial [Pseudomonadota bacterium]